MDAAPAASPARQVDLVDGSGHTASSGPRADLDDWIQIVRTPPPPRDRGGVPEWLIWARPPEALFEREDDDDEEDGRLAHHKRPRLAASSKAVAGLKEVSGDAEEQAECAVCLNNFCTEDRLRAMPCSHVFHHHCIIRWFQINHVCPLCRHALPTEEDDDYFYAQVTMPARDEA